LEQPVSNADLAARYDTIAYAAQPHATTHPDRLATVATFFGHAAASPETCRVLEVGCNDGANLIPMAVSLPQASFVGCDLSPAAVATGRATVEALGLANVSLLCEDLAALDPALGPFDFIVAHGVYSWVPAHVRDALFELGQRMLTPLGVMYVSFNTLPGCRVRQAAWEMVHRHVDRIDDVRARLQAARAMARLIADGGASQHAGDEAVRAELRAMAERSDSQLFHDDLAQPNEPVFFRDFVAHAARYGLAYLAEADPHTMSGAGVSASARQFLSTLDATDREQYLDFVRLRRFRQSMLRRVDARPVGALDPARIAAMHVAADTSLLRAAQASKVADLARDLDPAGGGGGPVRALLEALVRRVPTAMPVAEARNVLAEAKGTYARPLETLIRDAYVGGVVNLHLTPPPVVNVAGARPLASPLARWQAGRQEELTSLAHMRVRVPDANARRLLALLDGSRDRAALVASTAATWPGSRQDAEAFVSYALQQFATLGFLMA
jgi:protein-L-isoaspartate O-methyltransferase